MDRSAADEYISLTETMLGDPELPRSAACQQAVRRFLQSVMLLCDSGSAGLSVLRSGPTESVLCWEVVTGALVEHEGSWMPRDGSPCGFCLDTEAPIILTDPERIFPNLKRTYPWISEILAVPLHDAGGNPLGALWLTQHGTRLQFSSRDCFIAQQLAMPLVRMIEMLTLLESQATALEIVTNDLAEERSRRELAETAEIESRRMLGFRDLEIREAHHRVKNTIQTAAAVLRLQERATESIPARVALRGGHDRLHSLAAVHELLQRDPQSTQLVSMPELLGIVTDILQHSFAEKAAHVHVAFDVDRIEVAADHAIALALLANEAITNAYKHAFSAASPGELTVTLRRIAIDGVMLQISDNGAGLSAASKLSRGLGLPLLEAFAEQLGGAIELSAPAQGSGTSVTLQVQSLASVVHH